MRKVWLFLIIFLSALVIPSTLQAQAVPDFAIATTYSIPEKDLKEIEDGDILSITAKENILERTTNPYDEKMYGVYVTNPQIVFRTSGNNMPVARVGEVDVNVTTLSGAIARGDFITSSKITGKGQKASLAEGYLLGIALSDFSEKDGTELKFENKSYRQGKIKVAIGIGPSSLSAINSSGGFLGTARQVGLSFFSLVSANKEAEKIFRYILSALVAIISILGGIYFFGRNVTKGIESIGRNPLAKTTIQTMIIINVVLIGLVSLGGIILSLTILAL
ncbi:hypothetical protein A3J20_02630 [Candidatus Gottesmanbacteria bacterium RIFCSPLOWO2_02_FULL_42_29]|uniref:MacB-like periplasmic core domain-containing protein n=2 Tax=Candidatus Gottesmaniibacteriota TaxID=1752720 RepID=A0A1F6BKG3_9BACT|nr:MAG: hypothetical protein UV09_C0024G0008 [Candidatus Gottesmanbacteria bacterium GW2011_GWA2_42_18]OGG12291.1 MAG: hypothetical protein A2781_06585 [Candidatus Gottesmanbacteria bacterium RIFCSPHIGHO2_01_FULL_42_27]OGG22380.1 MAG: hypothetical protein A3E72_06415 [Candidatus Gottesmanbacteria bacterium RIFCSPHIGHO2_12_FULL_43_26]OGG34906.1 MAG: hypothetical protein A3G68_01015 [Candidatus Gottesmanbacteria bacterium RIFCSPLOWO2_12_FULL_42_10]OGG37262.1 MAG: hypothetical protein A2968_02465 